MRAVENIAYFLLVSSVVWRCFAYEARQSELGPEWWEVERCTVHDLDTWSRALVRHGKSHVYSREDLRLSGVDACEVSRVRQAVLERRGDTITDAEIAKGKAGLARFEREIEGGKRYIRLVDPDAAYGRWEVDMRVVVGGKVIDVAEWIRANGYERGR